MDETIKRKWVKALRSGKYKQGRNALKNETNAFCCLGVLCEVLGAEWDISHYGDLTPIIDGKKAARPGEETLRPMILRKVGLTKARQITLAQLNDGYIERSEKIAPQSFEEIANYIEKEL